MTSTDFWLNKIRAFLHDPPDKILKINNHEKRRNEILKQCGIKQIKRDRGEGRYIVYHSDVSAASLQRIDFEKSKGGMALSSQFFKIYGENYIYIGVPTLVHPITGESKEYSCLLDYLPQDEPMIENKNSLKQSVYIAKFNAIFNKVYEIEKKVFREIIGKYNLKKDVDCKRAYFELWATYLEKIAKELSKNGLFFGKEFKNLAAYTLSPDHTLLDHADTTSAIYGSLRYDYLHGKSTRSNTIALLMFKLSPVQDFIKNARKERDLWAGSHLISYLTFRAITTVVEKYGPDSIIFPHLRRQHFMDWWLYTKMNITIGYEKNKLIIPTIPNKFLAIIPYEHMADIRKEIEKTVKEELQKILDLILSPEKDDNKFEKLIETTKNQLKKKSEFSKSKKQYLESAQWLENKFYTNDKLDEHKIMNYKDTLKRIVENYFKLVIVSIPQPFNTLISSTKKSQSEKKEESYQKLRNFINSLDLPDKVREKYLNWIDILASFEVSENIAQPLDIYSLMFEILEALVSNEARSFEKLEEEPAWKCTLCGEHKAILGENYEVMKEFWTILHKKNPLIIKDRERLCPVCLIKRFYHEYVHDNFDVENIGFRSVSDVALRKKVAIEKNGEIITTSWKEIIANEDMAKKIEVSKHMENFKEKIFEILSKLTTIDKEKFDIANYIELIYKENLSNVTAFSSTTGFNEEEVKSVKDIDNMLKEAEDQIKFIERALGLPEKYYAILIMDADNVGKLLSGDDMLNVEKYLHPKLSEHLKTELIHKIKNTKRLITPAAHAAISRSLRNFSINYVTKIISENDGELIYTGGDDVFALLPVDRAIKTAYELEKFFEKSWDGWKELPGRSLSAGLLFVHYKHPLYDAIDKAYSLLKLAKECGKKAISIGYLTRSGTYRYGIVNWHALSDIVTLASIIKEKGKKLIYDILENIENLTDVNEIRAYLTYELSRHLNKADAKYIIDSSRNIRIPFGENIDEKTILRINDAIKENKDPCRVLTDNNPMLHGLILRKQIIGLLNLIRIAMDSDSEVFL